MNQPAWAKELKKNPQIISTIIGKIGGTQQSLPTNIRPSYGTMAQPSAGPGMDAMKNIPGMQGGMGAGRGSVSYTGTGEDGVLNPSKPVDMVQTDQGPKMIHEGEVRIVLPNGKMTVIPAKMLPQEALQAMEKQGSVGGYEAGTPDVQPNTYDTMTGSNIVSSASGSYNRNTGATNFGASAEDGYRTQGMQGLSDIAAGKSPVAAAINNKAVQDFGTMSSSNNQKAAMSAAGNPNLTTGAKNALSSTLARDSNSSAATLQGNLAIDNMNRADQATGALASQSLAGQQFQYSKASGNRAYVDSANENEYAKLLNVGDYEGAASKYETMYGTKPDMTQMLKDQKSHNDFNDTNLSILKNTLGDARFKSIEERINAGSSVDDINNEFGQGTIDQKQFDSIFKNTDNFKSSEVTRKNDLNNRYNTALTNGDWAEASTTYKELYGVAPDQTWLKDQQEYKRKELDTNQKFNNLKLDDARRTTVKTAIVDHFASFAEVKDDLMSGGATEPEAQVAYDSMVKERDRGVKLQEDKVTASGLNLDIASFDQAKNKILAGDKVGAIAVLVASGKYTQETAAAAVDEIYNRTVARGDAVNNIATLRAAGGTKNLEQAAKIIKDTYGIDVDISAWLQEENWANFSNAQTMLSTLSDTFTSWDDVPQQQKDDLAALLVTDRTISGPELDAAAETMANATPIIRDRYNASKIRGIENPDGTTRDETLAEFIIRKGTPIDKVSGGAVNVENMFKNVKNQSDPMYVLSHSYTDSTINNLFPGVSAEEGRNELQRYLNNGTWAVEDGMVVVKPANNTPTAATTTTPPVVLGTNGLPVGSNAQTSSGSAGSTGSTTVNTNGKAFATPIEAFSDANPELLAKYTAIPMAQRKTATGGYLTFQGWLESTGKTPNWKDSVVTGADGKSTYKKATTPVAASNVAGANLSTNTTNDINATVNLALEQYVKENPTVMAAYQAIPMAQKKDKDGKFLTFQAYLENNKGLPDWQSSIKGAYEGKDKYVKPLSATASAAFGGVSIDKVVNPGPYDPGNTDVFRPEWWKGTEYAGVTPDDYKSLSTQPAFSADRNTLLSAMYTGTNRYNSLSTLDNAQNGEFRNFIDPLVGKVILDVNGDPLIIANPTSGRGARDSSKYISGINFYDPKTKKTYPASEVTKRLQGIPITK
jgi:hypothetical protein